MPDVVNLINKEKYSHDEMTSDQLEDRIASDLLELSDRFRACDETKSVGSLLWVIMRQVREAYRTGKLILKEGG